MMIIPISTDRHDGSIGLASLIIIGICLLAHIAVELDAPRIERRAKEAGNAYRESQYQLQNDHAFSLDSAGDISAARVRKAYDSGFAARIDHGADSVANSVRQQSLEYRLMFTPAHFNIVAILTAMFMHGGWWHLIGNMIFFYVCGVAMEKYWGFGRFLIVYLSCGLAASLSYMGFCAIDWQRMAGTPCLGASGAIAGAMGAFLVTHAKAKVKMLWFIFWWGRGTFNVVAWAYLGFWFLSQVVFLLLDLKQTSGVAYTAHVGGFLAGMAFGWLVKGEDEASLVQPALAGKGAVRRAVLPSHMTGGASSFNAKAGNLSLIDQAVEREAQAIRRETGPRVAQSETDGFAALQQGDHASAARSLACALDNYLQAPQEHKDAIASILAKILEAKPPLPVPAAQLYQWAKAIYKLDQKELALSCLDRASLDASNPHVQKNSMLNAAVIRIQTYYQLETAIEGLKKLLFIEPDGIIANQAKQYLAQAQQMRGSSNFSISHFGDPGGM
ncbi:MAG TPA: rhomboid family intramembrane serine protease [Chitinivibrionales bacterium]|nr:rhomboid family intramembrane serine protease [Chitinivibrionales bacterium]